MIKLRTDELAAFHENGPHMQTLAESAHARVLLVGLKAGQRIKDHSTSCQVTVQIVRGAATVVENGRGLKATAGDIVIVPAGSRHRVETEEEVLLVVTLTPHPAASRYPADERDRIVSRVPHQAV